MTTRRGFLAWCAGALASLVLPAKKAAIPAELRTVVRTRVVEVTNLSCGWHKWLALNEPIRMSELRHGDNFHFADAPKEQYTANSDPYQVDGRWSIRALGNQG